MKRYPYCGHGTILGTQANPWQDCESVLAQFGTQDFAAKEAYGRFVAEGVALGRRPEPVGGRLARTAGGWFEVRSQRQRGGRERTDERILGDGSFVERILREVDTRMVRQHARKKGQRSAERVVAPACKKNGVSLTELRNGSRRGRLPAVRAEIVRGLVENYGVAIADVGRQVGISTSGASKILTRSLSS